jgi:hypothetical protein
VDPIGTVVGEIFNRADALVVGRDEQHGTHPRETGEQGEYW